MTNEPNDLRTEQGSAEAVFAAWAVRVENGETLAFEELVRGHPVHAEELSKLHADWKLFAPLLGKVVPGLIASSTGIKVAPLSGGDEDDPGMPSAELLDRLGIHAPNTGRYRFRSVLGRGGGGVVLKVWDTKLNRPLAMKVVLGRGEDRPTGDTPKVDSRTLTRFVDEARIASQLNHPGIVPVHELGADESGRAFFTMKLVKGEDLSKIFEHVKTGHEGWNQTRALGVLLKVCEAMSFAHAKGVIHRDLKPANVMVGRYGEVHVMDWGLARVLGEQDKKDVRVRPPVASSGLMTVRSGPRGDAPDSPLYTMDGDVVGTPAYMSPEQAAGDLARMGPHSDVYALGAMLYHLLAGHMPYAPQGARLNNYAVWQRVQEGPPTSIVKLAPHAPAELIAICEKAMEREIEHRYRDMVGLALDLQAFVEDRVVGAYETGAWAEGRKWVQRNKGLAVATATAIVAVVTGLVVGIHLQSEVIASLRAGEARLLDSVIDGSLVDQALVRTSDRILAKRADEHELQQFALARLSTRLDARPLQKSGEVDARLVIECNGASSPYLGMIVKPRLQFDGLPLSEFNASFCCRFNGSSHGTGSESFTLPTPPELFRHKLDGQVEVFFVRNTIPNDDLMAGPLVTAQLEPLGPSVLLLIKAIWITTSDASLSDPSSNDVGLLPDDFCDLIKVNADRHLLPSSTTEQNNSWLVSVEFPRPQVFLPCRLSIVASGQELHCSAKGKIIADKTVELSRDVALPLEFVVGPDHLMFSFADGHGSIAYLCPDIRTLVLEIQTDPSITSLDILLVTDESIGRAMQLRFPDTTFVYGHLREHAKRITLAR